MAKKSAVTTPFTKSQIVGAIAEDTGLSNKQVGAVLASLQGVMGRHLQPRSAGVFTLPGLAKFTVVKKAATKARKGINPFTKEETMFKAKPASRAVKVRVLKGLKDLAS